MEWLPSPTVKGVLPEARKGGTMTRLLRSSTALIYGGECGDQKLDPNVYAVDLDSFSCRRLPVSPAGAPPPRLLHTATAISRFSMVVFGGQTRVPQPDGSSQDEALDDAWLFDLHHTSWAPIGREDPNRPSPRSCHSAVLSTPIPSATAAAIIIFGGFNGTKAANSTVYMLRLVDWKWQHLPVLVNRPDGAEMEVTQPSLALAHLSEAEHPTPQYPSPRENHGAIWLPESRAMLIYGGEDVDSPVRQDFWLLTPPRAKHLRAWRWRELTIHMATRRAKNLVPPLGGCRLASLPRDAHSVLVWGGSTLDSRTGPHAFVVNLKSNQSYRVQFSGTAPPTESLLADFVRYNDRAISFSGCDANGTVVDGFQVARLLPSLKSNGASAATFHSLARPAVGDANGTLKGGYATDDEPLHGPPSMPTGTKFTGQVTRAADFGCFVSLVVNGKLCKGILVANLLGADSENVLKTTSGTDPAADAPSQDGATSWKGEKAPSPKLKRPRIDPIAALLPDEPPVSARAARAAQNPNPDDDIITLE